MNDITNNNNNNNSLSVRYLNVHEYQGADIMRKFGVRVPDSIACKTLDEVQKASEQMKCLGDDEVVVKSQILAGGRGRSCEGS